MCHRLGDLAELRPDLGRISDSISSRGTNATASQHEIPSAPSHTRATTSRAVILRPSAIVVAPPHRLLEKTTSLDATVVGTTTRPLHHFYRHDPSRRPISGSSPPNSPCCDEGEARRRSRERRPHSARTPGGGIARRRRHVRIVAALGTLEECTGERPCGPTAHLVCGVLSEDTLLDGVRCGSGDRLAVYSTDCAGASPAHARRGTSAISAMVYGSLGCSRIVAVEPGFDHFALRQDNRRRRY